MTSSPSPSELRQRLHELAPHHGVWRCGVARAEAVDDGGIMDRWLAEGCHASMSYMERHQGLRRDPRELLPGARSVISCLIPYHTLYNCPLSIAEYALGEDYHRVVRRHLKALAKDLLTPSSSLPTDCGMRQPTSHFTLPTSHYRVCVDSAPLRERWWAVQAGVGCIGRNGLLTVKGWGSRFFIGTILTTADIAPDEPCRDDCGSCGRCVKACPTGALSADGRVDSRRCLSYLTIEHRGTLPEGTDLHGRLYGCDACQTACPHNAHSPLATLPELQPDTSLLDALASLASGRTVVAPLQLPNSEGPKKEDFDEAALSTFNFQLSTALRRSAMSRAGLDQLIRNAQYNAAHGR